MDVKGSKHRGPKREKVDPTKLVDDNRAAHPPRPTRAGQDSLNDILGQNVAVRGSPNKIIEVVIKSE